MTTKSTPHVSVVVPNYNYGCYLEHRLESILAQTYQDFEIIYLDDCSTDNSEEVFSRFRDHPRIRAYHNESNSGSVYKQANKGVKLARGDYVWIAQLDDEAERDFLKPMVEVLDAHPGVGLAYCQSLAIDERDQILFSMDKTYKFPNKHRWEKDYINNGRNECLNYLLYRNTIPNFSAVVFRREIFEKAGYAEEALPLSGDQLTWIRMLAISDIAFIAKPMNRFRFHSGSVRAREGDTRLIEEGYQVLGEAQRLLQVSSPEMEGPYDALARRWLRKALPPGHTIPLQASLKIHRIARTVDPHINRRLLRRISKRYTIQWAKKKWATGS